MLAIGKFPFEMTDEELLELARALASKCNPTEKENADLFAIELELYIRGQL